MSSTQATPGAVCLFRAGGTRWFVDLEAVADVLDPGPPILLPLVSGRFWGLCFYRGRVLPVVRVGGSYGGRALVLVLRGDRGLWGLAIDLHGVEVRSGAPSDPDGSETRLDLTQLWDELRIEIEDGYAEVTGSPPSKSGQRLPRIHAVGVSEK